MRVPHAKGKGKSTLGVWEREPEDLAEELEPYRGWEPDVAED